MIRFARIAARLDRAVEVAAVLCGFPTEAPMTRQLAPVNRHDRKRIEREARRWRRKG